MITVIIPTHNRSELLKGAIESVLAQSYHDLTILVSDNASTDNTQEVVQNFQRKHKNIQYLYRPQKLEMVANFLEAFKEVNTPYVCFLPDDDAIGPDFLEYASQCFLKYPNIAFAAGKSVFKSQNGVYYSASEIGQRCLTPGIYFPPDGYLKFLLSNFSLWLPALVFSKVKINLQELSSAHGKIAVNMDEDLIGFCALRYPYCVFDSPTPCYIRFEHANCISKNTPHTLFEKDCEEIYRGVSRHPVPIAIRSQIDQFFNSRLEKIRSLAFKQFYQQNQFQEAEEYLKKLCCMKTRKNWRLKYLEFKLVRYFPILRKIFRAPK